MALVGLIESGTVDRIIEAVGQSKSSALLLLQRERQAGQVLFEEGEVISARVGADNDQPALQRCRDWSSGFYRLIRSADDMTHPAGLHALVVNADVDSRDRWVDALHAKGFRTSVTPKHGWMRPLVALLAPELILMTCPRQAGDCDCETLRAELDQGLDVAPLVVTVADPARRCEQPAELCQRAPLVPEALYQTLVEHLSRLPGEATGSKSRPADSSLLSYLRRGNRQQHEPTPGSGKRRRWGLFGLFSREKSKKTDRTRKNRPMDQ
jgi:hypothetical protein